MRIIEMKKIAKTGIFFNLIVESVNDERFELRELLYIDGQKYVIVYSQRLNPDDFSQPRYDITIKKISSSNFL